MYCSTLEESDQYATSGSGENGFWSWPSGSTIMALHVKIHWRMRLCSCIDVIKFQILSYPYANERYLPEGALWLSQECLIFRAISRVRIILYYYKPDFLYFYGKINIITKKSMYLCMYTLNKRPIGQNSSAVVFNLIFYFGNM